MFAKTVKIREQDQELVQQEWYFVGFAIKNTKFNIKETYKIASSLKSLQFEFIFSL